MFSWLICIIIPVCGYYLYYSDKGEILMILVRIYDSIYRNVVKPINYYIKNNNDITEIYHNNKYISLNEILNSNITDKIEILWKRRYRTVYNGNDIDLTTPFTSVNPKVNILYANLYKYDGDTINMIDVSILIDQYAGPLGDFFHNNSKIYNNPKNFYFNNNGVRQRMLEDKRDYILLMNKTGEEIELKL
tara:strand:- start:3366 stop:3935 length:570 start_codon:yes stop_codon:yes gene_type:complete